MNERTDAQMRYDRAMGDIRKGLVFHNGGVAAEARAAQAHADMVREGTANRPSRRVHRVGKYLKKVR